MSGDDYLLFGVGPEEQVVIPEAPGAGHAGVQEGQMPQRHARLADAHDGPHEFLRPVEGGAEGHIRACPPGPQRRPDHDPRGIPRGVLRPDDGV